MKLIKIDSPRDRRIAPYVNLRDKDLATRQGRFIAEGELVVRRLLASPHEVESLLIAPSRARQLAVPPHVPVYCAPPGLVAEIAGFDFHRGILGCGIRPASVDWSTRLPPPSDAAMVVVVSRVGDPINLGGILRNCAAFGADLVLLGKGTADPYSRRVLRVSMATALTLNVCQSRDLAGDLQRLQWSYGFHCLATVLDPAAPSLATVGRPRRLALVFGNEYEGVEPNLQQQCQSLVTLPMSHGTDSLNVAVATGIFLYHFHQLDPRGETNMSEADHFAPHRGGEQGESRWTLP